MAKNKASISKSKGTEYLSIIYRHPVKKDAKGKYGARVRRGLGTKNESIAKELVEQMNELLENESWWHISKRGEVEASGRFDKIIISAFYDFLGDEDINYDEIVDNEISTKGYTKALLLGTSGAGKTSLVRQVIGTGNEKFPTTSTGRTTTYDTEIICSDEDGYSLVVTFMSKELVTLYVEECIEEAIKECISQTKKNKTEEIIIREKIEERFLNHKDLTVRLSYILGKSNRDSEIELDEDEEIDDNEEEEIDESEEIGVEINAKSKVREFIDEIINIANKVALAEDIGDIEKKIDSLEGDVISERLSTMDEYLNLVDDVINEIQDKFNEILKLKNGMVLHEKRNWINIWKYSNISKKEFIKITKIFTSNNQVYWGSLLTPIVRKLRVKGPFKPAYREKVDNMMLIDSVGLGHTTNVTSISTDLTSKFIKCDSILLIDSATQPLMANSEIAIRTVIDSGNVEKLCICNTHMDIVKGENMRTKADKIEHVKKPLEVYLDKLQQGISNILTDAEKEAVISSSIYLWGLNKSNVKEYSQNEIEKLIKLIIDSKQKNDEKHRKKIEQTVLTYESIELFDTITKAVNSFRNKWDAILGIPYKQTQTEHWTRIKALTRRLGYFDRDNYNNELAPIADILYFLNVEFGEYFSNPKEKNTKEGNEEIIAKKSNKIKQEVFEKLHDLMSKRLWDNKFLWNSNYQGSKKQLERWKGAYDFSYERSTYNRKNMISEIFNIGAPRLGNVKEVMSVLEEKEFMQDIIGIVTGVLNENNSRLEKFSIDLNQLLEV